ncbi:MAG: 16S rRNA (guanine(966)-N(2))-methyltransferase RsmD [Verrucomicrobia bacterium]|jgi:16S rRNA (guanine966-N2)-methyltransferase|nr:16S rRNA (guanine(966)-N(2))-methyltransferase RsmD [Verrucomicrobiota bacterium]
MRVTGGDMGGRSIRVPDRAVRPTQDRVREALFSSLQAVIPDVRFLDLFAGSGAVGVEAWSRGASQVCWVEENALVFRVLQQNLKTLGGEDLDRSTMRCVRSDVFSFLRKGLASPVFDIIFADPPYQKARGGEDDALGTRLLQAVAESGMLIPRGIVILEQGRNEPIPEAEGWELLRDRRYGGSRVRIFRSKGDET